MIFRIIPIVLLFTYLNTMADTCGTEALLPKECKDLLGEGKPIAVCEADLNGDSKADYVVVVQQDIEDGSQIGENDRTLLVITKANDGYVLSSKNKKIPYCSTCGGVFGDPFSHIEAGGKWFSVSHYGGSAHRWSIVFKFGYSRRDNKWQLVEVRESSVHVNDPDNVNESIYKPPKDFGLINLEDFDPDNYLGIGER